MTRPRHTYRLDEEGLVVHRHLTDEQREHIEIARAAHAKAVELDRQLAEARRRRDIAVRFLHESGLTGAEVSWLVGIAAATFWKINKRHPKENPLS